MKLFFNFFIGIFCLIIIQSSTYSQEIDYSTPLRSPIDIPLVLAGNFGELRSNHFHTGIDIKTNQRTGYKIYAVEDGYVSRIRVSPWGYGHVVYIDHPKSGLTSVYAHLDRFSGAIQELTEDQQRKNVGFSFDYHPAKDSLKIRRGEVIAISGNTGGSTAPHLHFELRETITEEPLNPLLFKFEIEDNLSPTIRNLKVYSLTEEGYRVPNRSKVYSVQGSNGNFNVNNGIISIPASYTSKTGGIGFSFDVIDKLNAANNICGVYQATLLLENDTIFSQEMERISFNNNRQINTHKDYEEYHKNRRHFHKAFKTKHNSLPIYRTMKNNGIINAKPGESYSLKYILKDAYGNTSQLDFALKVEEGEMTTIHQFYSNQKVLYPDSVFASYHSSHYILFPTGLLYEPTPLVLTVSDNKIKFGNDNIPLQETFKLMLPIENQELSDKYYIKRTTSKGRTYSENGTVKDGWITSRVRSFGIFSTEIDTIPPKITARTLKGKTLGWAINENGAGLKDYNIYIDGEWFLLKYEPKKSLFFFEVPSHLKGEKEVTIKAMDMVGNSSEERYKVVF